MPNTGLTRDSTFPYIHASTSWGWHVVFWTLEAALVLVTNGFVATIGFFADVWQGPRWMRKWFMVMVNLNVYSFVFLNWLILAFVAYWMFLQEDTSLDTTLAKAFYRCFIDLFVTGLLGVRLVSTIRYWYWDGVIEYETAIKAEEKAERDAARAEEQAEQAAQQEANGG